ACWRGGGAIKKKEVTRRSGAKTTQTPAQPVAGPPANGTGQQVATMAQAPRPANFKPLTQLHSGEMLNDPRVKKMLADSATKHLGPDRMLRVIANAIRKVPKLAQTT